MTEVAFKLRSVACTIGVSSPPIHVVRLALPHALSISHRASSPSSVFGKINASQALERARWASQPRQRRDRTLPTCLPGRPGPAERIGPRLLRECRFTFDNVSPGTHLALVRPALTNLCLPTCGALGDQLRSFIRSNTDCACRVWSL